MQLRDYFTKEIRSNLNMIDGYKQKGSRPISAFYQVMGESKGETTFHIKTKWEAERKIQIRGGVVPHVHLQIH